MYKLDLKDRKILYELDIDSRQPYSQIAKKVGLSKDSVTYRIEKLLSEGVIKQFRTIIDTGKLGYISFRLYLRLENTTSAIEAEIVEWLKKDARINWLVSIDGRYNLGMWVLVKDILEMEKFWSSLFRKYVNYIGEHNLVIFSKVLAFSKDYFLVEKRVPKEFRFISLSIPAKLDEKDLALLKELAYDSRVSVLDLSEKLMITPKTVSARIKELEKRQVIVGYRAILDLSKLGYEHFKLDLSLHNITENKEKGMRAFFRNHKNVVYDNFTIGGKSVEIEIDAVSLKEFRLILGEIKDKFSTLIKSYDHMTFFEEYKFLFFPV